MKIVRLGERYFDLHSPAERARVSSSALEAFFGLMSAWEVAPGEQRILLGRLTGEELAQLQAAPRTLDANRLKRIATLLAIHRELRLLYGPSVAGEWVRIPNSHPMFCSVTPLHYMLIGGLQAMTNVLRLLAKRRRADGDAPSGPALDSPEPARGADDLGHARGNPQDLDSPGHARGAADDLSSPVQPRPPD